jgi:hypothetical protein
MDILSNLSASMTSPMVLAFLLGIVATLLRSDLKFPDGMYAGLTIYLLFAIGLKGGVKLSGVTLDEVILPVLAAISMCLIIPVTSFFILNKIGKIDTPNAAALAAHFGSVSAVTFNTGIAFMDGRQVFYEGYVPALLAIMEVPAIIMSLYLAKRHMEQRTESSGKLYHELFTNKGTVLLIGGIIIGIISGKQGYEQVSPLFNDAFRGVLCLFLLEVGLVAGRRLGDLKRAGLFLAAFSIIMPVVHATAGIFLAKWVGMSVGGATIFGLLCGSASYIAAPAAVRIALPEANPSLYLTASLAIVFPFNVTLGLPLYLTIAQKIYLP